MNKKTVKKQGVKLVLLALLVQGCASNHIAIETRLVDQWKLNGKIAIAYPSSNCKAIGCPPRSDQGGIDWTQDKQNYTITLNDPFGRRVINIEGNEQSLTFKIPNKPQQQTTPENFVRLLIGQSKQKTALSDLTPRDLQYWLTGRPVPKIEHVKREKGVFEQKGYTVTAKQWRGSPIGNMPSLVVIKKANTMLRLVIRDWMKL